MKKQLTRLIVILVCREACAQSMLPGLGPGKPLRLQTTDSTVLELQEPKRDIPCTITPFKAQLGFDFMFHTGYRVTVPMRDLAGAENMLTILFRVIPAKRPNEPVYFSQRTRVPLMKDDQGGDAALPGEFLIGAGKYHVDWLMRDLGERFCAGFWDIDAKLSTKEGALARAIPEDLVLAAQADPFADEPNATKQSQQLLNIKVIVNFAPQPSGAPALHSADLDALLAILRKISREPRIGRYSIVACSLQTQQIIYRQQTERQLDLPALGRALTPTSFATVSINQLGVNRGHGDFLGGLILEELDKDHEDAVIVVSPDCEIDLKMSDQILTQLKDLPVFYLNYKAVRLAFSDDAIGRVVKRLHGREYIITQPRDLFNAWSDIVSRLSPNTRP